MGDNARPCIQGPHRDGNARPTGRVIWISRDTHTETTSTGMCDRHLALAADRLREEGRQGVEIVPLDYAARQVEIRQVGAQPYEDAIFRAAQRAADREMTVTKDMVEAFQRATRHALPADQVLTGLTVALFSRFLETSKNPELHPGNSDLDPATVEALAEEFVRTVVALDEGGTARNLVREIRQRLWEYAELHEDDLCDRCHRPRSGVSKGCSACRRRHPEMYRRAYGQDRS